MTIDPIINDLSRPDLVAGQSSLAYLDRQSVMAPFPISPLDAWTKIMSRPLPGLGAAFALRDWVSALFGVKRIGGFSGAPVHDPKPGDMIDFFLIERLEDHILTLSARDRHLDVMICVMHDGCEISVTASVITHNLFGRIYMIPVAPAHRLITRALLRRLL